MQEMLYLSRRRTFFVVDGLILQDNHRPGGFDGVRRSERRLRYSQCLRPAEAWMGLPLEGLLLRNVVREVHVDGDNVAQVEALNKTNSVNAKYEGRIANSVVAIDCTESVTANCSKFQTRRKN